MAYALEAASLHPAQCLGIEQEKGTLNYGADADLVLLDSNFNVLSTWVDGKCSYQDKNNKLLPNFCQ